MPGIRARALAAAVGVAACWAVSPAYREGLAGQRFEVVHQGYADFARGTFENAGENLYVSRRGRLQLVHRWDLDGDGTYDLVFANTHNTMLGRIDALGYLQTERGFRSVLSPVHRSIGLYDLWRQEEKSRETVVRLTAERPSRVLFHDVDRDGYPDLVFASLGSSNTERHPSLVYWGAGTGLDRDLRIELDTVGATDAAAGDLDLDGYEDLVFANRGSDLPGAVEDASYIYWGSGDRHGALRRSRVATGPAVGCALGDLDGDGHPELVFATSGPGGAGLQLHRGSARGPALDAPVKLPLADLRSVRIASTRDLGVVLLAVAKGNVRCYALTSAGLTPRKQADAGGARAELADLDGDGRTELVVADGDRSAILWGNRDGWSAGHATRLPTLAARDLAIADLDRDGRPDLVFANHSEGTHGNYDVPSYVYWGKPWGYGVAARTELQTFGASAVAAGDLNRDGRLDLVFGNSASGIHGGKGESVYVYWGRPHRGYSPSAMTAFPAVMPMSTAIADLDDDGHPELLVANSGRHYMNESGGSYLYRGKPGGPDPGQVQEIAANEVGSWMVADLDRDGHLDAVACDFDAILIARGGPEGLGRPPSPVRISDVARAAQMCRLVDYDRDGWLDIVVADVRGERSRVLLGGPRGYSTERSAWIDDGYVSNFEFADLDGDGFLDMILLRSYVRRGDTIDRNNSWMRIRYGGPRGWDEARRFEVPTQGAFDAAVADLDGDGDLDVALTQYSSRERRNLPFYIFWNDGRGAFSAGRRTVLPAEASSGLLAADFDADGRMDLLVANHNSSYKQEDNHSIDSYILWGTAQGLSLAERTFLPNHGPHWMQVIDAGNLATRRLEEHYVSPPVDLPQSVRKLVAGWRGETPHGSRIGLEARTAPTPEGLARAPWRTPATGGEIELAAGHRHLQYRVALAAGRGYATPYLTAVTLREAP